MFSTHTGMLLMCAMNGSIQEADTFAYFKNTCKVQACSGAPVFVQHITADV